MTSRSIRHEPPGFFIKEELDARGWNQADLAFVLDIAPQQLGQVLSGKVSITAEMAVALGDAFDMPAEFFSNLQKQYDLANVGPGDPAVKRRGMWQATYPLREMIARGWVEDADAELLDAQMLRFFEAKSLGDVPHLNSAIAPASHAAKKSTYEAATPEQLAWLYRVRQIARSLNVAPYSPEKLLVATHRMLGMRSTPDDVVGAFDLLADAGVRFLVVEALPRAKIDGVCTWLSDDKPVIALSNRHDRLDNFWFVLRHEIEHVLRGHGRDADADEVVFDDETTLSRDAIEIEERQANDAAADFCVPTSQMASFIARKGNFVSEADVLGFARRLAVHPAIVVGQYQFVTKKWSFLRKYLSGSVSGVRKSLETALAGTNMMDGWKLVATVDL